MNRRMLVLTGLMLAGNSSGVAAQAPGTPKGSRWVVDIVHSQIDFRVRHLLGRVRGTFTNWYAVITTDSRGPRKGWRGARADHVRCDDEDRPARLRNAVDQPDRDQQCRRE